MAGDQSQVPFADAVNAMAARDLVRLLVPGHAGSAVANPVLAEFFGEHLLRQDFGCLVTGLDKGPGNPLQRAQELAADAWGATRAWFLTNGASQANRLAALALTQLGDPSAPVVMQRSVHSSVIDGVVLAGLDPVFVVPSIDRELGINHGVTIDAVAHGLRQAPAAKAVWVVSPSYFGAVADIAGLADLAHAHGIPLVVDGAWGSHFGFHEALPANPIALGADLVVSSTHKSAGSLTQTAMLHLGHGEFARALEPLVDRALPLTASTSVSLPLLASLDIARAGMVSGRDRLDRSLAAAERIREAVRTHPLLAVVSDGFAGFPDIVGHDPMRVSIDVTATGVPGTQLREHLGVDYGVYVEIATHRALVGFIGPGDEPRPQRLLRALDALAAHGGTRPQDSVSALPPSGPRRMLPRDAFLAPSELVDVREAAGRVSSDSLSAYPPGIPNVIPGEELTDEVLDFLQATSQVSGGFVRGAVEPRLGAVRVVRS